MCVCVSSAEHSQDGTDEKVKLPNYTEDFNWQGLADLYSVNETLYERRVNYRPSQDDWTNFEKDVDSMFALLSNLKRQNQTNKLDPLAESGSGDDVEASGEGPVAMRGDVWPRLVVPTTIPSLSSTDPPSQTPSMAPTQQEPKLLEALNELPEAPQQPPPPASPSGGPPLPQPRANAWLQQLEDEGGMGFSGNGLTELETRHEHILRAASYPSMPAEPLRDLVQLQHHADPQNSQDQQLKAEEEEEGLFQAQVYLPLSPRPVQSTDPPGDSPLAQPDTPHRGPSESLKPSGLEPQDTEGSGLAPLPTTNAL